MTSSRNAAGQEAAAGRAGADIAPDRIGFVAVEGGQVAVYVYGDRHDETVLAVNGGPGVGSRYLRGAAARLARRGWRVVIHDQLGTGASDKPDDPALWTLRRYVAELEAVRRSESDGPVHLWGHSWGGMLGIEYVLTHPGAARSLVLSNTSADTASHLAEIRRLLGALGAETLAMIDRHEREGTTDHIEYRAASTLFYARHSARSERTAEAEGREVNMQIQEALWGRSEFSATGELAGWSRLDDLRRLDLPCLVLVGAFDYTTPHSAGLMQARLPDARLVVFPDSGHAPFVDEPEAYFGEIDRFLRGVRSRAGRADQQSGR